MSATKKETLTDATGMLIPAPLIVYLFGLLGVPLDAVTAAGIGTAISVLGALIVRRVRAARNA